MTSATRRCLTRSTAALAVLLFTAACSDGTPTSTAPLQLGGRTASVTSQRMFAINGASGTPSTLYQIDPATGAIISTIGATGFSHVVAMDFDPTTGVLYGIANNTDQLLTINTTTGVGTVVANMSWPFGVCGSLAQVPDMSFDSNGNLFAWRDPCDDDVYRVDKVTGVATPVGESFIGTARIGIAFDSNDQLWVKNIAQSFTINTTTGAATFVANLECCSHQNMLAFDENDVAYTGGRSFGSPLYIIDLTSSALTFVGNTNIPNLAALAFERFSNQPPVCSGSPSVAELWPPDHSMRSVSINGVTDPDGDATNITINSVFQDEPVNGLGDGDTAPDATGVGTATASVRAERSGTGDGRVYVIAYTATDGRGGSCSGTVEVSVRHSQGKGPKGGPAVNSGATYDSSI
jgi:hypothetical protein